MRGAGADTAAAPDAAWAEGVRETAGGARVCVLDAEDERCRGRAGGILRLSPAYAEGGADAARVFVVYTPARERDGEIVRTPGPVLESVFRLERRGGSWRIAEHRTVRAP